MILEKTLETTRGIKETLETIRYEIHASTVNRLEEQRYLDNNCELFFEAFTEEIIKFKRQRNSLSFVSQLPFELIRDIIWLSNENDEMMRYSELSHVSHSWRRAIITDAKLWSNIHLDWPLDTLNTILARSEGVKLSVTFPTEEFRRQILRQKLETIFPSRQYCIETLNVSFGSMYHLPTYLNDFIGQTLPNLKHLTFKEGLKEILDGVPFISNDSTIQTLDILLCNQKFAVDPLIAAFRTVRSLKLAFQWNGPLYTAFLREAHTFTRLEELYLVGFDDQHIDNTPIYLPNLTTLLISGIFPSIFKRFETPKLTNYDDAFPPFSGISPKWHMVYNGFDYPAIRFLCVEVDNHVDDFVDLNIFGHSQQEYPEIWTPRLSGSVIQIFQKPRPEGLKSFHIGRHVVGSETTSKLLSLLLPRLILLRDLRMDLCRFPTTRSIKPILLVLREINTLRRLEISADQDRFVDIINMLRDGSHCFGLETLVFLFSYQDERLHPTCEELTSFIGGRGKTGTPLRHLVLENCNPLEDKQCLTLLETLGTRVTFNAAVGSE